MSMSLLWHAASLLVTCAGILSLGLATVVACMLLVVRPWDARVSRPHRYAQSLPFAAFALGSWLTASAEALVALLKPPPIRVAELSIAYIKSRVLGALVELRVADALASGPKTAQQLAPLLGPSVAVAWLDRLLLGAAAFGMLRASSGTRNSSNSSTSSSGSVFSLNAVSAVLASDSPVCMAHFVAESMHDSAAFTHLAEGIRTSRVPFELHSGGESFWSYLQHRPDAAARFDGAMLAVSNIGGGAVVRGYPWRQYDSVIDVAGGLGGFMVQLLSAVPSLHGVVLDQPAQIEAARKLWSSQHGSLLPRVQLVPGDMFDAATVPSPPSSASSTAYVLRNILHDWGDEDSVRILRALRSRCAGSSSRVRLLVIEATTAHEVLPWHAPVRHSADLTMLAVFGEAKERNRQQFAALLAAGGWRLARVRPTAGILQVLEAEPDEAWQE